MRRKFHIIRLVLLADGGRLGNVLHVQQLAADIFNIVLQLAMREAVGGKGVDDAVGVAKFVIKKRSLRLGGHILPDVAHFFAHLIPDVGHVLFGRARKQLNKNCGFAGQGIALEVVE